MPSKNNTPPTSVKGAKPKKPAGCPLTPHPNGKWCRKHKGTLHYFGSWRDLPGALRQHNAEWPTILAGQKVPHGTDGKPLDTSDGLSVREVCNEWLEFYLGAVRDGEKTQESWDYYRRLAITVSEFFELSENRKPIAKLGPNDFLGLKHHFGDLGYGLHALGKAVRLTKTMLSFAEPDQSGLIDHAIPFGKQFRPPSAKAFRREKARRGKKMFTATEIHELLDACATDQGSGPQLRAMVLLGINCGFNPRDCELIEPGHLRRDNSGQWWHDLPRGKEGIERRGPLWPETQAAVERAIALAPAAKRLAAEGKLFRTRRGNEFGRTSLSHAFRRIAERAGCYRRGHTFQALRHTFKTIGGETRNQSAEVAVEYLMGHADHSVAGIYRELISDERLIAVSEHIRSWLYAEAASSAA